MSFANTPPEETTFVTTQLWDKYLPRWRIIQNEPKRERDPEEDRKLVEKLKRLTESPELTTHNEHDGDKLDYVMMSRNVKAQKGKWRRFSEETEKRIRESQNKQSEKKQNSLT